MHDKRFMERTDEDIGFAATGLVPLCQPLLTLPFNLSDQPQQHIRQVIKGVGTHIVNQCHQQRMPPWGDVLP